MLSAQILGSLPIGYTERWFSSKVTKVMVLYSEWVFGGVFKIFIRRFVGFLFYFSLLNVCKIKLLELVLWFLWWVCTFGSADLY